MADVTSENRRRRRFKRAWFPTKARGDPAANGWQRRAEGRKLIELHLRAPGRPIGVIDVLLAPCVIPARGLEMAIGVGREPHIGIGRRNGQRLQPVNHRPGADPRTIGCQIRKTPAPPPSGEAGVTIGIVSQPHSARAGVRRFGLRFAARR